MQCKILLESTFELQQMQLLLQQLHLLACEGFAVCPLVFVTLGLGSGVWFLPVNYNHSPAYSTIHHQSPPYTTTIPACGHLEPTATSQIVTYQPSRWFRLTQQTAVQHFFFPGLQVILMLPGRLLRRIGLCPFKINACFTSAAGVLAAGSIFNPTCKERMPTVTCSVVVILDLFWGFRLDSSELLVSVLPTTWVAVVSVRPVHVSTIHHRTPLYTNIHNRNKTCTRTLPYTTVHHHFRTYTRFYPAAPQKLCLLRQSCRICLALAACAALR